MSSRTGAPRQLGVAHLTALDLSPEKLVRASARAGFASVGLRLAPAAPGAIFYSIPPGSDALKGLKQAMSDEGVSVNEIEFVPLVPGIDLAALEPLLEAGASVSAKVLTVSGDDPDPARLADTLASLCDMALPFGMRIDVEFMRWRSVASYTDATALIKRAAHPNAGILLDVLHLDRSGGDFAQVDLSSTGPVRAVQLCDAVAQRPLDEAAVIHEAREGRLVPGEGALPLSTLISRLRPEIYVSVEVPDAARPPEERLLRAANAARAALIKQEG